MLFGQDCKIFNLFLQVMGITWVVWDLIALYLVLCQTWKTVKLLQLSWEDRTTLHIQMINVRQDATIGQLLITEYISTVLIHLIHKT